MRLIKLNDELVNEDRFIKLVAEKEDDTYIVSALYLDDKDSKLVELARNTTWREAMRDAAQSMLFDLEHEDEGKDL
jgi:hypothetical protein